MWIVLLDQFLMKKLLKIKFMGLVNNQQLQLKKKKETWIVKRRQAITWIQTGT